MDLTTVALAVLVTGFTMIGGGFVYVDLMWQKAFYQRPKKTTTSVSQPRQWWRRKAEVETQDQIRRDSYLFDPIPPFTTKPQDA